MTKAIQYKRAVAGLDPTVLCLVALGDSPSAAVAKVRSVRRAARDMALRTVRGRYKSTQRRGA